MSQTDLDMSFVWHQDSAFLLDRHDSITIDFIVC